MARTVILSTPGGMGAGTTRDPDKRQTQRWGVVHQVEQVIKSAVRIGRRPLVQLGLHLPYPQLGPVRVQPRDRGVHHGVFGHYSSLLADLAAALGHVPGFPGLRLLRRLRPVPTRSVDGGPSPEHRWHARAGTRSRRFPCSLTVRSSKEAPGYTPAASPRLPRSTSLWPPDWKPDANSTVATQDLSITENAKRAAFRPHHGRGRSRRRSG